LENTERFFVVTGGPGSGKSTLLGEFRRAGFPHMPEAGRAIIQDQLAIGGSALPWRDRGLFAELMLSWDIRSYRFAEELSGPVFFDRGVVDVIGYLGLLGLGPPGHMKQAAATFRYHRRVLVMPPWEDIYERDVERKQDFQEAVRTYEALIAVYSQYGYELVEVPRVPVAERVSFVVNALGFRARG
jgi:predicted ATPase